MNENRWCYCKHSKSKFMDDSYVTWCDKREYRIFYGDATLCDGCPLFEQDDEHKAEYDKNNGVIPKPTRYYEESVFSSTRGFYKTWVKGDYNGTTSLL